MALRRTVLPTVWYDRWCPRLADDQAMRSWSQPVFSFTLNLVLTSSIMFALLQLGALLLIYKERLSGGIIYNLLNAGSIVAVPP